MLTVNDKSVDGVLGTQTRASRMVSVEEWRHPLTTILAPPEHNINALSEKRNTIFNTTICQ